MKVGRRTKRHKTEYVENMSAFEDDKCGVGDFVLLDNINIDEFMKNLQLR